MKVTRIAWTTGTESINRTDVYAAVGGTDLGILWDDGNNRILSVWGDTFSDNVVGIGTAKGLDWRNNVLARSSNRDFQTRGVAIEWWNTDRPNHARQIIPKDPFGTEYTMIPTAGISINRRQYIAYMAVDHWGTAGNWVTQYAGIAWSDDFGQTWTKDQNARWNNNVDGTQNWQMVCFVRPGDGYVYLYGTPNGRFGGAKVARAPEGSLLNLSTHRQWNGTAWVNDQSQAINVIPSPVSELSITYHHPTKQWLAAYYHSTLNGIVVLTSPNLMGPWSAPSVVATAAEYPGLYGFYFHPWSVSNENPCASMSQWPPYQTELMLLSEIPGTGGAPINPSKLKSAQGYVNAFSEVNNPQWCGTNNIFPVQATDGRRLWISGLSYAGYLTSQRRRPLNYQTIANTILEERDQTITAYKPSFYDSVGRGHLFDSRQIPGIRSATPQRLDPVGAVSVGRSLYLTVAWSDTYTLPILYNQGSTISGSSNFMIEVPLNTLASGESSIRKSVLMPSTPVIGAGNLNFGTQLYVFDETYMYIGGRSAVTSSPGRWNHYLARVNRVYLDDVTYVPQNMEYFSYLKGQPAWDPDIAAATPVLRYMGPNIDIRKDVDGYYHYLINVTGKIYLLKQQSLARDAGQISPLSLSLMTIPVDAGATSFSSPMIYDVGWANLTSGNRLGAYTVIQTNQSFDQNNPWFARPHFFEYNKLMGVAAAPTYTAPPS